MNRGLLIVLLCCAAAACGDRQAPPAGRAAPPPRPEAGRWLSTGGQAIPSVSGDTVRLTTGPHVVAWDPALPELRPPYRVSATLQKRTGRLHEGVGLVFGASGLEGPESAQVYSYFLVRGDGSFLVKKREGAGTPVVRDWTRHPAIRRDDPDGGRPNRLEVAASDTVVVFRVNGAEVARIPAGELSLSGRVGIRAAHDVELWVSSFQAEPHR